MKKYTVIMIIGIIALLVTGSAYAGEMMKHMSKESLVGSTVTNLEGDTLGKISDVSIDENGKINFAILSHGGIMGMGEKLIPIPINALSIKEEKLAVVDISKEKLNTAPSFTKDTRPDMSDRTWAEDTSRFYGVRPYWEEREAEPGMKHEMQEMKEEHMEKMEEMKEQHMEQMREMPMEQHKEKSAH